MKVYIQTTPNGLPRSTNFFNAYQGFHEMGFETLMFSTSEELQASQRMLS